MVLPPLSELFQRIDSIYYGKSSSDLSLQSIAASLKVNIGELVPEALVIVVGDSGSGKTSFVNALAQEFSLPAVASSQQLSLKMVLHTSLSRGMVPRLLKDAATRCPDSFLAKLLADDNLSSCCSWRSASEGLQGVHLMEASLPSSPEDKEALTWLASRAAVVVCLLDSMKQPPQIAVSDDLLQWLARLQPASDVFESSSTSTPGEVEMTSSLAHKGPALHFVLSKSDLITRNSDRIRFCSKAQRQISDRLGRSFEILPTSVEDKYAFLDMICDASDPVFTVGGVEFTLPKHSNARAKDDETKLNVVFTEIADLAREVSMRSSRQALQSMKSDCETLVRETELQLTKAYHKGQAATSTLRGTLMQVAIAFFIVGSLVPFVLEEDVEEWLVILWISLACGVALVLLAVAFFLPAPPKLESNFEQIIESLQEQGRYLRLLGEQWALWCGETFEATSLAESGKEGFGSAEGAIKRNTVEVKDDAFSI